jgi:alanine racemase
VLPAGWLDGLCVEKARDLYNFKKMFPYVASDIWRCIRHRRVTATVNGSPVPVLGHIGMQHTMADVTSLECKPGDIATLQVSPAFFSSGMKVVWT